MKLLERIIYNIDDEYPWSIEEYISGHWCEIDAYKNLASALADFLDWYC